MDFEQKINKRLEELEIKIAFQEDTIEALNAALAEQTLQVQKLWDANRVLKGRMEEMQSQEAGNSNEPPPPHY